MRSGVLGLLEHALVCRGDRVWRVNVAVWAHGLALVDDAGDSLDATLDALFAPFDVLYRPQALMEATRPTRWRPTARRFACRCAERTLALAPRGWRELRAARRCLQVAQQHADGAASDDQLAAARTRMRGISAEGQFSPTLLGADAETRQARWVAQAVASAASSDHGDAAQAASRDARSAALADSSSAAEHTLQRQELRRDIVALWRG